MKKNKLKNQNGAISLFVMLSMLFFLMFMLGAYTIVNRRNQAQVQATTQLKSLYSSKTAQLSSEYKTNFAESDEVIPISNATEFSLIATGKSFEKDGKIYTCKTNGKYQLTNDIIIDIDNDIAGKEFNFSEYVLYNNGNSTDTASIDTANYQVLYYKENAYWKCLVYQNVSESKGLFNEDDNSDFSKSDFNTTWIFNSKNAFCRLGELNNSANNFNRYTTTGTTGGNNYEFLLMYDISTTNKVFDKDKYKRWLQSANPITTEESGTTNPTRLITNASSYPIKRPSTGDTKEFQGLAKIKSTLTASGNAYLNGDLTGTWYNAVCTIKKWNNGIPAGNDTATSQCLLFVRVEK